MIVDCVLKYNSADSSVAGWLFFDVGGEGGRVTEENGTLAGCVCAVWYTAYHSGMLYLYTFPFFYFCSVSVFSLIWHFFVSWVFCMWYVTCGIVDARAGAAILSKEQPWHISSCSLSFPLHRDSKVVNWVRPLRYIWKIATNVVGKWYTHWILDLSIYIVVMHKS